MIQNLTEIECLNPDLKFNMVRYILYLSHVTKCGILLFKRKPHILKSPNLIVVYDALLVRLLLNPLREYVNDGRFLSVVIRRFSLYFRKDNQRSNISWQSQQNTHDVL